MAASLRRSSTKRFTRTLLVAFAASLGASCGGGEEPVEPALEPSACEGRAEPVSIGMDRASEDGALFLEVREAAPMPPETGDNAWTLEARSGSGEPVEGGTVVVNAFMVDHGHGSPAQQGIEVEAPSGVYEVSPILLSMPGYWELTFEVTPPDGPTETLVFPVCVERT